MTWQTMYPANPGSPYTTLASGIDEDDTSISLTADPGFAAATNLACIWDDTGNFEVVKYTDLTGTTLTVERALEGTARVWSAGAYIANLIPAYAINSLQNNINELNSGKVSTTRTVNSKALSADISLTPADVGSASSTTAALSILVYDGTPSAGDLTTYDEIYTTPALCFAALPAIINHAVTITVRKADGSAYAAATLQRVVAGGSITIQGEYYYNNTIASAGSGTGKFNVIAAHSGLVQTGDRVFLMKYTGTVGASTPSDAFIDTVAGVSGTEITLTDRTTDAFDNSWRYVIVRTVTDRINVISTPSTRLLGLNIIASSTMSYNFCDGLEIGSNIFEQTSTGTALSCNGCVSTTYSQYNGFILTGDAPSLITLINSSIPLRNVFVLSSSTQGSSKGTIQISGGKNDIRFGHIKTADGATICGLIATGGAHIISSVLFDGYSSSSEMAIAMKATQGGNISGTNVFGSYITTQKSPANWAATTDGSYIS